MQSTILLKNQDADKIEFDWGTLIWYANQALGNTKEVTLGKCILKPHKENPKHSHPNCSEVLFVEKGKILHTFEDGEVEMSAGDSISLPPNFVHNAKNLGDEEAVLLIAFTSANRKTEEV